MVRSPKVYTVTSLTLMLAVLLYIFNWLSVYWLKYPFLYCWAEPVVAPTYFAFSNLASVVILAGLFWCGMRKQWIQFVSGAAILTLVLGAPRFADVAFKMGGVCGG